MCGLGLAMKSRRSRDSLSTRAQLAPIGAMVLRQTEALGLACATRASTDRTPYVCLRAHPARGSLRDPESE